jgi:DNA-binding response OmpR family regulator
MIVDDDRLVRSMLGSYLRAEGMKVSEAPDGSTLIEAVERLTPEVVLLDLMLPGEDGLSLLRRIRSKSNLAIIIVTSRNDVIDRVAGLEAGADDYMGKPAHPREVLARIRTVLRRTQGNMAREVESSGHIYRFEGFTLQADERRLLGRDGRELQLTGSEFDLLLAFVSHPRRALNRDQLMELVKGRAWAAFDRSIDQRVGRLRRKIEPDPANPRLIKAVRGVGYLFAGSVTRE